MQRWRWIVALAWIGWASIGSMLGCGEDPKELFETAQFEERQANRDHARELYERIIEGSPDSEWATKARVRLKAWEGGEED